MRYVPCQGGVYAIKAPDRLPDQLETRFAPLGRIHEHLFRLWLYHVFGDARLSCYVWEPSRNSHQICEHVHSNTQQNPEPRQSGLRRSFCACHKGSQDVEI